MRRLWLRLVVGLALAGLLVAATVVGLRAYARTEAGARAIGRRVALVIAWMTGADVRVGRVAAVPGSPFALRRIRVWTQRGLDLRIAGVEIDWRPAALLQDRLHLPRLTVIRPRLRLPADADAAWIFGSSEPALPWLPLAIAIDRLEIDDGRVVRRAPPAGTAPEAISSIDGRLALSIAAGDWAVCVSGLHLTTGRSRIEAGGCADASGLARAKLVFAPLAAADVGAVAPSYAPARDLELRVGGRGPWSDVDLAFRLGVAGGGRMRGTARVDLMQQPHRWMARGRFADFDPQRLVADAPSARLNGRGRLATGAGAHARVRHRLRLERSRLAGWAVDALALRGRSDGDAHDLRGRFAVPAGRGVFRGRVELGAPVTYTAVARLAVDRPTVLLPGLDARGRARVAIAGAGIDPATAHARVEMKIQDATVGTVPIERGLVTAALAQGVLQIATFDLAAAGLHASGEGSLDVRARTIDATVRMGDAGKQPGATGVGGPWGGMLHAAGPLSDVTVQAELTGEKLMHAGVAMERIVGNATLRGLGGTAPRGEASLDAVGVRVGALGRSTAGATITWERGPIEDRWDLIVATWGETTALDRLAVGLVARGGAWRGTLRQFFVTPPTGASWQLAAPVEFTAGGGAVRVPAEAVVHAGRQRVSFRGRVATKGTNDALLRAEAFALGPLCEAAGVRVCSGRLGGQLALTGTATAPVFHGRLDGEGLAVGSLADGTLAMDLEYENLRGTIDAKLDTPHAGTLAVAAAVPVDLAWAGARREVADRPLAVDVSSHGLSLGILELLVPEAVRGASGNLSTQWRVRGTRAHPTMDGGATVEDGALTFVALGVPWTGIDARLDADGAVVRLTTFRAQAGAGVIDGRGAIDLAAAPGTGVALDFRLVDLLAVRTQRLEATIAGTVRVRGGPTTPEVAGALEITRMVMRPPKLAALTTPPPAPDPTIDVVGLPERAVAAERTSPPVGDALRLALEVRLARDAWLRVRDASIELGGIVMVEKDAGGPLRTHGRIVLHRGWYAFEGHRFVVREGVIVLPADSDDSEVDVTGVYRVRDYDVIVRVHGPAGAPELTMWSEPALAEADVLSLLLFGKTTDDLTTGQAAGLEQQSAALASRYVVGDLVGSVRDRLGLDLLEVDMPTGSDGAGRGTAGRVTAGRYVSRDVFVSLGQEFGGSVAEVFGMEYGITRRISVRGSTTTTGRSSADVVWRLRY
jgi:autotransporter translocation and assembly factor TamB